MNKRRHGNSSLFAPPRRPKPPARKWRIHYVIWNALKRTCMVLGAFMLISAVISIILAASVSEVKPPALPKQIVLYLPIDAEIVEHIDFIGHYGFGAPVLTLRELVETLDRAGGDARVKGLVVKLEGDILTPAQTEELRTAVGRFRAAGKFAYIYAQSYDSLSSYYFASAFEQIWLQPMGVMSIAGVNIEVPYARPLLDRIGIEPQVFARKDYKNLFESLTDSEMSPQSREMLTALADDISRTLIDGAAASRNVTPVLLRAHVDTGLLTADEALAAALIDRLDYSDNLIAAVKEQVAGDPEAPDDMFVDLDLYAAQSHGSAMAGVLHGDGDKPQVALIYALGNIIQTDDGSGALAAADRLVPVIRDAADDESIDVIVLRIDSPGGDPTAAETIRRAVVKAREKGKKIVVSMSDSAASGGYWIAADADRIFALPTTLTGSIGVTGGKLSLEGMWEKAGIKWDGVQVGANAGLWSFNRPYSAGEAARMDALMDHVYDNFIRIVAQGRGMSEEQVDSIAGGRVWTGAQALQNGLVDDLGGLDAALDHAAVLSEVESRSDIEIIVMPAPLSPFEKILDLLEMQVAMGRFFTANRDVLTAVSDMAARFRVSVYHGGFYQAR